MEQAPKKIRIEVPFQKNQQVAPPDVAAVEGVKCRPYELIKINRNDLVDRFSRKIGHTNKLTHKSMCQAYNQALIDAQYLLMAAEKDTQNI